MLEENYWAHFAPSGKTPWDFILGSGYRFTFAGENLAKNFYGSEDVVAAWMASQTHKENILNSKYKDIGIAVVDGVLDGQSTTLVVQMFGSTSVVSTASETQPPVQAKPQIALGEEKIDIPQKEYEKPHFVASAIIPQAKEPLIDPYQSIKIVGFSIISFILILMVLDLLILRRRGVFRFSSHHLAHMAILGAVAAILASAAPGSIL